MSRPLTVQEAGSGDPVVLLHAFPLNSQMWAAQRAALADRWRVVTPDLPGFGGSPLPAGPPSLELVADSVAATLDELGLDRVVLGGLSLGGYVTMAFLRRHPDRVRALVLADTRLGADSPEAAANRERIAAAVLAEPSVRVVLTDVLAKLIGKRPQRRRSETLSAITDLVRSAEPESIAWMQRAMAVRPDSTATLAAAGVPALVLVGDEDELTPPADAEAMVAALPEAELTVLATAGHISAMETPDEVTKALRTFLDRLDARD